jgi:hypothetical protein
MLLRFWLVPFPFYEGWKSHADQLSTQEVRRHRLRTLVLISMLSSIDAPVWMCSTIQSPSVCSDLCFRSCASDFLSGQYYGSICTLKLLPQTIAWFPWNLLIYQSQIKKKILRPFIEYTVYFLLLPSSPWIPPCCSWYGWLHATTFRFSVFRWTFGYYPGQKGKIESFLSVHLLSRPLKKIAADMEGTWQLHWKASSMRS